MARVVKLSWDCDRSFQSFNIYKSKTPFNSEALPIPFATNVFNNNHTFIEEDDEQVMYYLVSNGDYFSLPFYNDPYAIEVPLPLTIVNPNSDQGIVGWNVTVGQLVNRMGYFYGIGADLKFFQDIEIPSKVIRALSEKDFYADLTYKYGGWASDGDQGYTTLICLDKSNNILGSVRTALESVYFETVETFLTRNLNILLPKNTVKLRIECTGVRISGTNLDAYWTNFKLNILDKIQEEPEFDKYVKSLNPLTWLKLDEESSNVLPKDHGSNQVTSYTATANIDWRQIPLRKGHKGAMGFSVRNNDVSRMSFIENQSMIDITKGSHTWFIYLQRTANNNQERLFGDNGDGVNKRVCWSAYDFPNNQRQVPLRYTLGQPQFICIVYNVEKQTYKLFTDGNWYDQTYLAPPTSTIGGQTISVPATSGYTHYGIRGYVSDFTWFNRALTEQEVENVYSLGRMTP